MRAPIALAALLLASAACLAVTGCSDDDGPAAPAEPTDEEILGSIVTGDSSAFSDWFDIDALFGGDAPSAARPLGILGAPIDLVGWRRDATPPYQQQVTATVTGDSAFVESQLTISGTLHLFTFTRGVGREDHPKPFGDVATRRAVFHRYPDSTHYRGGWRLEQLSGVEFVSAPVNTVTIDSIMIGEVMYRSALDLMERGDIMHFESSEIVPVHVYTSGSATYAFLHTGRGNQRHRGQMEEVEGSGGHHFHGEFTTPALPGVYQIAVDLVEPDVLMDDDADAHPYDSSTWMVTYAAGTVSPD